MKFLISQVVPRSQRSEGNAHHAEAHLSRNCTWSVSIIQVYLVYQFTRQSQASQWAKISDNDNVSKIAPSTRRVVVEETIAEPKDFEQVQLFQCGPNRQTCSHTNVLLIKFISVLILVWTSTNCVFLLTGCSTKPPTRMSSWSGLAPMEVSTTSGVMVMVMVILSTKKSTLWDLAPWKWLLCEDQVWMKLISTNVEFQFLVGENF